MKNHIYNTESLSKTNTENIESNKGKRKKKKFHKTLQIQHGLYKTHPFPASRIP